MEAPRLRPLGIGESLDAAIKIYTANFWTLVRTVFIVVAPVQVLTALVRTSANGGLDTTTGTVDPAQAIGSVAALLIVFVISSIATQLATATVLKVVSSYYLGETEDWRSSLRFAFHRLGSVLWITFLVDLLAGLGLIACVVPGVYFYFAWSVAIPVLLIEGTRGFKAMRRSRDLVSDRWWSVFGAIFVATIITAIITGVLESILIGITFSTDSQLLHAVATAVAAIISATVLTPFTASVIAVVYFDLRVRKEGFDLELLARSLGVAPPAGTTPAWGADVPAPPPPGLGGEQPPYWPPPPGWRPGGG